MSDEQKVLVFPQSRYRLRFALILAGLLLPEDNFFPGVSLMILFKFDSRWSCTD